jgi:hypothetical protein
MTPAILEKRLAVPECPARRDSTFAARPAVAPYQISIGSFWQLGVGRFLRLRLGRFALLNQ